MNDANRLHRIDCAWLRTGPLKRLVGRRVDRLAKGAPWTPGTWRDDHGLKPRRVGGVSRAPLAVRSSDLLGSAHLERLREAPDRRGIARNGRTASNGAEELLGWFELAEFRQRDGFDQSGFEWREPRKTLTSRVGKEPL